MLGIDIEAATPLEVDLWESILTPNERAALTNSPEAGLQASQSSLD